MYKPIPQENENYRELLGVMGLNPFAGTNSASRKQMFGSHITQTLVTAEPDVKKIQTGMEQEYGKYTFATKMPENGRILKIISRYPTNEFIKDGFKLSPETIAFYESEDGRIGMIQLNRFFSLDSYFGWEYASGKDIGRLRQGEPIEKGAVFLDSPNKDPDGNYLFGHELNMAFMSHPCVAEDGFGVCRDVLHKLRYKSYVKRVVEWGGDTYPLNLYGDDETYKIFPDIGEYVHPHDQHKGLLMSLRKYDPALLAVDQTRAALRRLDTVFDKSTYVEGAGGRVVDIKVYHQPITKGEFFCDEMMQQAIRYRDGLTDYCEKILSFFMELKRERGSSLDTSLHPDLHRYLVDCMAIVNYGGKNKLSKGNLKLTEKKKPMDVWRAEFIIEYTHTPHIGGKLTCGSGGKGVITNILEPEQMPVAANGLRADVVGDGGATINRMNFTRTYEQYLNGLKYDITQRLIAKTGINPELDRLQVVNKLMKIAKDEQVEMINYVARYHYHVNRKQSEWLLGLPFDKQIGYLADVIRGDFIDYHPPETDNELIEMKLNLDKEFNPTYGPVTFMDNGKKITTVDAIPIGSVYMLFLKKTGHEWSSVSTAKTQQNGIISYTSASDKYATPTKQQAVRILGESEIRLLAAYGGGEYAVELHDRSNNVNTRKEIVRSILEAENPADIESVVDRTKIPLGYSKPLQMLTHILECAGVAIDYKPFDPSNQTPADRDVFTADKINMDEL